MSQQRTLRFALFYHSLISDWNHGNAHFLRGVVSELQARRHEVLVYEPADGWSLRNLLADHGAGVIEEFRREFPHLKSTPYRLGDVNLHELLSGVDVALVHEWNDPALVAAMGGVRRENAHLRLFFHDTHHRVITAPDEIHRFDLSEYDGILAYGASLKSAYERIGWGKDVHVWHEAADIRIFYPRERRSEAGDLVWIGNWGDEERTDELREYFINPVRTLGLRADVHGVRYPEYAVEELTAAGIRYRGWLPNFKAPEVFAQFKATVHVPRRPYTRQLAGIPTIRPFEALACGIPLISAPWSDTEQLFRVGRDFLMVHSGAEMERRMRDLLGDEELRASLAASGLETVRARHTCGHRVNQLLEIYQRVQPAAAPRESAEVKS